MKCQFDAIEDMFTFFLNQNKNKNVLQLIIKQIIRSEIYVFKGGKKKPIEQVICLFLIYLRQKIFLFYFGFFKIE